MSWELWRLWRRDVGVGGGMASGVVDGGESVAESEAVIVAGRLEIGPVQG